MLHHEVYGCDEWIGACVYVWSVIFKLPAQVSPLPGFITSAVAPYKRFFPPFLQQVGVSEFSYVNVDQ